MTAKFRPRIHTTLVRKTAIQLGIRNTALAVLNELCRVMSFKANRARISRDTLIDNLGRSEKSVKAALKELRDKGIIEATAYARGGRGRSPVYRLRYSQEAVIAYNAEKETGEKFTPVDIGDIIENRGKNFHKQGKNFPQTGEKISPPTYNSNNSLREKDAPSRGAQKQSGGNVVVTEKANRIRELLTDGSGRTYAQAVADYDREQNGRGIGANDQSKTGSAMIAKLAGQKRIAKAV